MMVDLDCAQSSQTAARVLIAGPTGVFVASRPRINAPKAGWEDGVAMRRQPVLPNARAATFTAVCVGLGAAAHLYMSAAPIPPWAVLTATAAVYGAARMAAAGRERSLLYIVALMGTAQVFLHLLFSFAQNLAATDADTIVSGNAVIQQLPSVALPGTAQAGTAVSGPSSMSAMPGMDMSSGTASYVYGAMHMGPGMLMAHAAAALICSWYLRRGETALHHVVRMAARRLRRSVGWHAPVRPRQFVQPRPTSPLPALRLPDLHSALYVNTLTRRGPPMRVMLCS